MEEWRAVGMAPKYEVSSLGRVRRIAPYQSTSVGRVLRPDIDKDGYHNVRLSLPNGSVRAFKVSRLVTTAFHGDPPTAEHEAAHGSGVRSNNCASNLRWATPAENQDDRHAHGTDQLGERNPRAKLTANDVDLIRSHLLYGERKSVLSRLFGVTETTIRNIASGKLWSHLEFQL